MSMLYRALLCHHNETDFGKKVNEENTFLTGKITFIADPVLFVRVGFKRCTK